MKTIYLQRAIISGGLWLVMLALPLILSSQSSAFYMLIPAFALAIMLGKAIMETVSSVTGFTFFFSGYGLVVFYILLTVFAIIVAPVYCGWNVIRYVLEARKEQ